MIEETITIPLDEYEELKAEQKFLACLNDAGVDNWDGYDFAQEMYFDKS